MKADKETLWACIVAAAGAVVLWCIFRYMPGMLDCRTW